MANDVTVDQLAIKVVAEANTAAASIDTLTASLSRLAQTLAPVQGLLARVTKMLQASKGATPALTQAMNAAGNASKKSADEIEKGVNRSIRNLQKLEKQYARARTAMGARPTFAGAAELSGISGKYNKEVGTLRTLAPTHAGLPGFASTADAQILAVKAYKRELGSLPGDIGKVSVAQAKFAAGLGNFQNITKGASLMSPAFPAQMDQAKRALTGMKTQLAAVAREQSAGGAFNPARIARYTMAVTAAENRLKKMAATAAFAQKVQSSTGVIGGAGFPQAPMAYTPGFTKVAAAASATPAIAASTTAAATAGLAKTGTVLDTVKGKIKGVTSQLSSMGKVGTTATKTLGGSFISLRSTIFFAFFALTALVGLFKFFVGAAMSLVEKINLFQVSLGKTAAEANVYSDAITNALGIDPVGFRETLSTFYLMASSLGMVAESATTVSRNFTQLAYDYASLREMDFKEVETKFRSAMAGQTRAIAAFGLDVTIASLQEEALREGIEGNVRSFTKANKIILMHNLIVRNSAVAHQDLSRTLSSPANMMRILKDQFSIAARTIGYMFIPALQAVLPWLIFLTQALTRAAQAFLGLFGIKMPSWSDYATDIGTAAGGTDDLFEDMDNVADATGSAADAAKKLRDYVMGIDELNILSPETATSGGGGGGGAGDGGGGLDIVPFDVYDMIGGFAGLDSIVDPIKEKFKELTVIFGPFIKAVKDVWEALKPFAKNVWQGFKDFYEKVLIPLSIWTMNTVGVAILEKIRDILQWFNDNPKAAEALGVALGGLVALKGLNTTLGIIEKLLGLFTGTLGFAAISGIIGTVAASIATFMALFTAGDITTAVGLFFAELGSGSGILTALASATGIAVGWWALLIVAIIAAVVAIVVYWDEISAAAKKLWKAITDAWDGIVAATKPIWEGLVAFFTWIWSVIVAVITIPIALIGTVLITAWEFIKAKTLEAWNWVYDKIKGPLEKVVAFITPIFNTIRDIVRRVWDGLVTGLQGAWDAISRIFKTGVNFLIRAINNGPIKMLNAIINAAKAVDKTGLMKGVSTIATIPYLASGGVPVTGSMFVAGEAGAELVGSYGGNRSTVMPLENSGFVEAMASAVYSATVSAMRSTQQSGGTGDVYIDGVKAGKIIKTSTDRASSGGLVSIGVTT